MNNEENLRKWALHNQQMINNVGTKVQREILAEALKIQPQTETLTKALKIQPQTDSNPMLTTAPVPISRPVEQPLSAQQPKAVSSSPSSSSPIRTIVTGDSVATGIGHGGARGNNTTEAAWGRGSAEQLAFMRKKGADYYRDANVVLSSGVLNSGDLKSVEAQLQFLRQSGVKNVRLAGGPLVGPHSKYNQHLKNLAKKYGFQFIGGYDSNDGVHPSSYVNYR